MSDSDKLDLILKGQQDLITSHNELKLQQQKLVQSNAEINTRVVELEKKLGGDIESVKTEALELKEEISNVDQSCKFNFTQTSKAIQELETAMTFNNGTNNELHDKMKLQEKQIVSLTRDVNMLRSQLSAEVVKRDSLEQQGRRWQVEISGLKHYEEEQACCKSIVTKIATLMRDVPLELSDVDVAHRTYNKKNIIVQFSNRTARDRFFAGRFSLKNIGPDQVDANYQGEGLDYIFINEVLSFDRRALLYKVKTFCKAHGISGVRVEKGLIKVIDKDEQINATFRNESDLERFKSRY